MTFEGYNSLLKIQKQTSYFLLKSTDFVNIVINNPTAKGYFGTQLFLWIRKPTSYFYFLLERSFSLDILTNNLSAKCY